MLCSSTGDGLSHGTRGATPRSGTLDAVWYLQLGEHGLGARNLGAAAALLLGVDDLALVDDDGVPRSALAQGPAEALGELGAVVARKQLYFCVGCQDEVS